MSHDNNHKKEEPVHHEDEHLFVKRGIHDSKTKNGNSSDEKKHAAKKHKKGFLRRRFGDEQEKLSLDQISENLAVIYQNQDGTLPDMKNFQRKSRSKFVRFFFTLLLLGCSAIVLAFGILYIWSFRGKGSDEVVFTISATDRVKIGSEVTFRIHYQNPQNVPLSKTSITVRYPQGFVFDKSNLPATNDNHTLWELGTVEANAGGTLEITGHLFGSLGQSESLRAFFNYLPANFSSEFQKISTFAVNFSDSPVALQVGAPSEASFGAIIPLEVNIVKDPNFSLSSWFLQADSDGSFVKKSSTPLSDSVSDLRWTLDPRASTSTVKIQGAFLSSSSSTLPVSASSTTPLRLRVMGYQNAEKSGEPLLLGEFSYAPALVHTALETQIVVNGARDTGTVLPGQNITAHVSLKNTGATPLKNVEVSLVFDAPMVNKQSILDWAHIEDPKDGTIVGKSLAENRRQGTIVWTNKQIPALSSLAAGAEVTIDVILPVKKSGVDSDIPVASNIFVTSASKYEIEKEQKSVQSNLVELTMNSDLSLEVRNEISGANNEIHTVTWLLGNTVHPLKDIELSADIYGDVDFDQSKLTVPAGNATYDKAKKTLKWKIGSMPLDVDVYALQFTLVVNKPNPSQTQLTSKVKIQALDMVTQKTIVLAGDEVLANVPQLPE